MIVIFSAAKFPRCRCVFKTKSYEKYFVEDIKNQHFLFIHMNMIVFQKQNKTKKTTSLTKTKDILYTEELFKAVLVKPMGRKHNTAHSKHIT